MSELLFECYGVRSITYCVDGLLSFHHNNPVNKSGLIINVGNCTTHIMPVFNGFVNTPNCRRIRLGGGHLTKFLWRWLQLRYPQHLNAITISRSEVSSLYISSCLLKFLLKNYIHIKNVDKFKLVASFYPLVTYYDFYFLFILIIIFNLFQEIIHNHVRIANEYIPELVKWTDPNYYEKHVLKVQLPYTVQPTSTVSAEQTRERRKEAAKRLVELNAKKREEKVCMKIVWIVLY